MNHSVITQNWPWITFPYREIVLTLIITGLLVSLSWQSVTFIQTLHNLTQSNTAITSRTTATDLSFKITDFSPLFGITDEKTNAQFIPKTSLNLKLKGALSGSNNEISSAIIQNSDGIDRLYRKGDRLPGGAVLDQVHTHYVIIQYQGTFQKLIFPENKEKAPLRQSSQLPTTQVMHSLKKQQNNDARQLEQRIDTLRSKLHPSGN